MVMRLCGECTKCCDGWLYNEVYGNIVDVGNPCPFIDIHKGCSIYENRPDGCKKFNCSWLLDKDIPENFKPSVTGVIIVKNDKGYYLVSAPNQPNKEMIDWFKNRSIPFKII